MKPGGIYIHIPFCKSRCSYCDFATDVYRGNDVVERYVDALCGEIDGFLPQMDADIKFFSDPRHPRSSAADSFPYIDTIYFGGGTPSLLRPDQLERILSAVHGKFEIADGAEVTMEMNPATVTPGSLAAFRDLGVNRASFGVQTFNERDLKLLARGHDATDARNTYGMLRDAGFANVSFDLIAGLPGQTMDDWRRNLNKAVAMRPEHLSLYLLEIHESTPLAEQLRSGRRELPDEELAADMYELMIDRLAGAGYEQYEISNFARPGFASRHNSKYWTLDPVYGFGVSAHSFDGTQRYANDRDTARYVSMMENSASAEVMREDIDLASEFVFLGLRLTDGIDLDNFQQRFGIDIDERVAGLVENELVEVIDGRLRLTRRGMLFSNEVFAEFV
ncbi:MAG: radical SAM family heme chaperone HemW [Pyrinomonadaceae bacterium]|nr:radical SAM family heme chaperone HemW [Pyrinomonadaceae bacterium]MBP6212869.1 radical SAM family heme chaperone HemW [Pyrinomonadaceae bacterium]